MKTIWKDYNHEDGIQVYKTREEALEVIRDILKDDEMLLDGRDVEDISDDGLFNYGHHHYGIEREEVEPMSNKELFTNQRDYESQDKKQNTPSAEDLKAMEDAPKVYTLAQDGEIKFQGTENECYYKLQRLQSQSFDWAMKYEGWTIK